MGQPLAEELQRARLQVRSDDAFNQRIHIAALGWKRIGLSGHWLSRSNCKISTRQNGRPTQQWVPEANADRAQGLGHRVRKGQLTPLLLSPPISCL